MSSTVTSSDGTRIAYETTGSGDPLILVDGAMCHRASGPMRPLAELLTADFTVHAYDRRGRGESGDTLPYTVDREVEDLRALIDAAGGRAHVYTMSSGAPIALRAAASGAPISRLALYEPPFTGGGPASKEYTQRLRELLDAGDRGGAVALFMEKVGMPAEMVAGMRTQPFWAGMEAIAPTLAYDDALMAGGDVPHGTPAGITVPSLVIAGGASPAGMRQAAEQTAKALPTGRYQVLADQTHDVSPEALAPALKDFLTA